MQVSNKVQKSQARDGGRVEEEEDGGMGEGDGKKKREREKKRNQEGGGREGMVPPLLPSNNCFN